jgi:hypothetical protein
MTGDDESLNNFSNFFIKLENNNEAEDKLKRGMWVSYFQPIKKKVYFRCGGWFDCLDDNYIYLKRDYHQNRIILTVPLKTTQEQKKATVYYKEKKEITKLLETENERNPSITSNLKANVKIQTYFDSEMVKMIRKM